MHIETFHLNPTFLNGFEKKKEMRLLYLNAYISMRPALPSNSNIAFWIATVLAARTSGMILACKQH